MAMVIRPWSAWLFALGTLGFAAGLHAASERGVSVTGVDGKSPAEFVTERSGKAWAVVIGIDQYRNVPKLTYAATDANRASMWCPCTTAQPRGRPSSMNLVTAFPLALARRIAS
jgi:hypothetical protein